MLHLLTRIMQSKSEADTSDNTGLYNPRVILTRLTTQDYYNPRVTLTRLTTQDYYNPRVMLTHLLTRIHRCKREK